MSVQPTGLNKKPVIALVLVLLAVVVVVNVVVFKPGARRRAPRTEVRVQAAPPLPADLGVVQAAGPAALGMAVWSATPAPRLRRDPFGTLRAAGPAAAQVAEPTATAPAGPAPLACNAVLLGGGAPVAVINGKSYRPDDTVRGHRVRAIGTFGVKLTTPDGQTLLLPVRESRGGGRSLVVTEKNPTGAPGTASLVEHAKSERK